MIIKPKTDKRKGFSLISMLTLFYYSFQNKFEKKPTFSKIQHSWGTFNSQMSLFHYMQVIFKQCYSHWLKYQAATSVFELLGSVKGILQTMWLLRERSLERQIYIPEGYRMQFRIDQNSTSALLNVCNIRVSSPFPSQFSLEYFNCGLHIWSIFIIKKN